MATKKLTAAAVLAELNSKGYTATQVVNSVSRKLAHLERHVKDEELVKVFTLAKSKAEKALAQAHAEGFVPCGEDCMAATVTECVCHCGGKNHGIHAGALVTA